MKKHYKIATSKKLFKATACRLPKTIPYKMETLIVSTYIYFELPK